jgi:pimeloyl-ACP methyl ester carboxylesterase
MIVTESASAAATRVYQLPARSTGQLGGNMSKKAEILLIHGAWADGSCWNKVILLLEAKGYTVTAAQIPLTSLQDDIEVTRRLLSDRTEPTVLVGHSYGGAVITGAATTTPQVKALVYITAFGLDEGESLESLASQGPPPPGSAAVQPDSHGFLWINREKFHKSFAADVAAEGASVMAAVQKPLALAAFSGKEGTAAWKTIPSWYLVCTDDQMIPPPAQEFLAKRMKATVRSVASSHSPFKSQPQAVADIIALAADAAA